MLPFGYLGQDTGSLYSYYYGAVYAVVNDGHTFVILSDSSGHPIIQLEPHGNTYNNQFQSNTIENFSYSVKFHGDFSTAGDDAYYGISIANGDAISGYGDPSVLSYSIIGIPSGILWDRPNYSIYFSAVPTGINRDLSLYSVTMNSGVASGILMDKSIYSVVLESGIATGILIDAPIYAINFSGILRQALKENLAVNFSFIGGTAGKGSTLFTASGSDGLLMQFAFIGGAAYR